MTTYIGRFWHALDEGSVQCDLCPRSCSLKDGQRGYCFVRQNQGGKLVLTAWGRSSGFAVDPVEKKPLYHFYPGSRILSFGTAGCNLGCRFCQNWDLSRSREMERMSAEAAPEAIARLARQKECLSVAFTYNEPIIFAEYALETAAACREAGIHTAAVTAGYISDAAREEFFAGMDAANVDLKAFTDEFYREYCGARLQPVLDTLLFLKSRPAVWTEITHLVIPGANDGEVELHALTEWIAENLGPDVPLHFSAFHPAHKLTDRPPTPVSAVQNARRIALSKGLRYVYTGNVRDREGSTTFCPGCGALLILRDGYAVVQKAMVEGKCETCGTAVTGRF